MTSSEDEAIDDEGGGCSLCCGGVVFSFVPAGQSLENNSSTQICRKINDGVFELYMPSTRKPEMEIVFVHGLQLDGNLEAYISTWRSRTADGALWPKEWLPEEFPKARILTAFYYCSIAESDTSGGHRYLSIVAESLLNNLLLAKVGQRCPVILIGYGFGGLVIKKLCVLADTRRRQPCKTTYEFQILQNFFQHIRAIYDFATPHQGSHVRKLVEKFNGEEDEHLKYVKLLSENLAILNDNFNGLQDPFVFKWRVAGRGETLPPHMVQGLDDKTIVNEESPKCEYFFEVDEDHISVNQPQQRDSNIYSSLCLFISKVREEFMKETSWKSIHQSDTSRKLYCYPLSTTDLETYVPIHGATTDLIIKALEEENGPPVILLHGDPGTGKSTLARYIGQCYAESYLAPAESKSTILNNSGIKTKFIAVLLECGSPLEANFRVKLSELYTILCCQTDQWYLQATDSLQRLMMENKLLIILDDVRDSSLVEDFICFTGEVPTSHVKFLVTSRISTLYGDATTVETQEISTTDAEMILVRHLGFTSIPKDFQEYTRVLVQKTGKNPLALAMVAKSITRRRREDPGRWRRLVEGYSNVLGNEFTALPAKFGSVLDCGYKRSIGETLMLTYNDLEEEDRHLLILIANCDGPSVPIHVVQMMYKYTVVKMEGNPEQRIRSNVFESWRDDVEGRGTMLRLTKQESVWFLKCMNPGNNMPLADYETWGLHDLQKEFLNEVMKEDGERLTKYLLDTYESTPTSVTKTTSDVEDETTVLAFAALYLRKDIAEKAAEKLDVNCPLYSFISVLRDAVLPLVCLIREDRYDENIIRSAKQVLTEFICRGGFDDQNLSRLLTSPVSGTTTAAALLRILHYIHHSEGISGKCELVESGYYLCTHTPDTIRSLLPFVRKSLDESCPIQNLALPALMVLGSFNVENRRMLSEDPFFFQGCIDLLSSTANDIFRSNAVTTMSSFCTDGFDLECGSRMRIGEIPDAIEILLRNLFDDIDLQEKIAFLLMQLVQESANCAIVSKNRTAIRGLLSLLTKSENLQVRSYARTIFFASS